MSLSQFSGIGYGLSPDERERERAKYLARLVMPLLEEAVKSAKAGRVKWDKEKVSLAFRMLDEMAPIVDAADLEEQDKLMLHGVLSGILRMRQSEMLDDHRLKIAAATMDILFDIWTEACEFLKLEVDRA